MQKTADLLNRTQDRLSSGKKVNSALDNPTNYFAAQSYSQRASDLDGRKDGMSEAVQQVKAANAGITAITSLIESAKGLASSALSTSNTTTRASFATQYDNLRGQIDKLAADSSYGGKNLLQKQDIQVNFNEDASSNLTVSGFSANSTGLAITANSNSWSADSDITTDSGKMDASITTLRTNTQKLSANLNIITTRQEFTSSMMNTLSQGADNLTLADMNQEGANMLMLQTRQSLGTTALSLSSQAAQSILRLF
jgi:flagellin-like hook-associated protein FlgL